VGADIDFAVSVVRLCNSSRVAREEIFGPVLWVIPYCDEAEAVRIVNDSQFGLGGMVWSGDLGRGVEIARQMRTGAVGINGFRGSFDAPFGGIKASGMGEKIGPEGLYAY
jgi:aldehyde dehydrogenase (NAD+)